MQHHCNNLVWGKTCLSTKIVILFSCLYFLQNNNSKKTYPSRNTAAGCFPSDVQCSLFETEAFAINTRVVLIHNWQLQLCGLLVLFVFGRDSPQWATASSFLRFLNHTQRRITVGRTPLDEWSARRRDLYLTTHNTHNRHTSIPPVGFEPTISAGDRPQTDALDRGAHGTGVIYKWDFKF